MTLPRKKTNSILAVERFLIDLLYPSRTKRVPAEIRRRAGYLLRHFPNKWDLEKLAKAAPEILGKVEKDED